VKAELALVRSAEIRAAQFKDALEREKQRADAAVRELGTVSTQLASARAEMARAADTDAASERRKAASAGDVDDLKRMVAAAMSDYVAARGLKGGRAQERAQWETRPGFTPAALLFQLPLTLPSGPDDAAPGRTEDRARKAAPARVAPTAALPKAVSPAEPESTATVVAPRGAREQARPEAAKPLPPRPDRDVPAKPEKTSARNETRSEARSEPRRASPGRETNDSAPNARVLFLPRALQPIDEEWEFQ
jgi:hypothetical protein